MAQAQFEGKIAVVTGAASGLGLAIAERLAADGAKVVVSDINAGTGKEVAARLGGSFVQADMGKRADCRALIDQALAAYGTVHILVNNAGFQHVETIEAFPEDVWDKMQAVMLTAPFLLTKYVWPAMKAQRWGRIVNISSIHGLVASPNKAAYISAKHGLVGLTKTAALEGGAFGITANAICPAYVRTPLVDKQIADQARTRGIAPEEVIAKIMLEPAAVKRLIEPAEVADFAAYLCGDSAGVITGAALTMDLGWTARKPRINLARTIHRAAVGLRGRRPVRADRRLSRIKNAPRAIGDCAHPARRARLRSFIRSFTAAVKSAADRRLRAPAVRGMPAPIRCRAPPRRAVALLGLPANQRS